MSKASTAADEVDAVLRSRAVALARRQEAPASRPAIDLLEFRLGLDRYAVETHHVGELLPLIDLTPVPCTPAFIRGVVNVRGRITAVVDIHQFFGLPQRGLTDLHHVILVRAGELELGLLADAIVGARSDALDALQPALHSPAGIPAEYMMAMTADRVLLLDLARMLADARMIVNEETSP